MFSSAGSDGGLNLVSLESFFCFLPGNQGRTANQFTFFTANRMYGHIGLMCFRATSKHESSSFDRGSVVPATDQPVYSQSVVSNRRPAILPGDL